MKIRDDVNGVESECLCPKHSHRLKSSYPFADWPKPFIYENNCTNKSAELIVLLNIVFEITNIQLCILAGR